MPNWKDVTAAVPELASFVRTRIDATGLAFLATLRRDGFPRISGIEPLFALDELWLGMMYDSRKARDLQRDPRLSLHNASVDKDVTDGDVKITGRAVEVDDPARMDAARRAFAEHTGHPPPDGPMHLFAVDVAELVSIQPAGDHLEIRTWRHGAALHVIKRY